MSIGNSSALSTDTAIISQGILALVNIWGLFGNILIIVIITRTAALKGFSAMLMTNQAAADILQECVTLALIFVSHYQMVQLSKYLRLALFGVNGVVSHSLSALSANIYLAICKQRQYKNMVTWKRVYIFLGCSWALNIAIISLYHAAPSLYDINLTSLDNMNINLTSSNFWFLLIVVLNIVVLPFCTASTCYLRIRSFLKCPTVSIGPHNMKMIKLSQMIHIMTIIYLLTYVAIIIVISVNFQVHGFKAVFWTVSSCYHILKLFLYLKLHKPLRETAKKMWCKFRQSRVGHTQGEHGINAQTVAAAIADRQNPVGGPLMTTFV